MQTDKQNGYFNKEEFDCNCGCGLNLTTNELLDKLNAARKEAKIPFIITSGTRCVNQNERSGGARQSSHIVGEAADLAVSSSADRWKILQALLKVGIRRIGVADTFIHVDVSKNKVQDVIWTY